MKTGAVERAVALVMDGIAKAGVLHRAAQSAVAAAEAARGAPYSQSYRHQRVQACVEVAREAVEEEMKAVAPGVVRSAAPPEPPTEEIAAYGRAVTGYEMAVWRQKIDRDSPSPQKPMQVAEYERDCDTFVETFRVAAEPSHDWSSTEFAERLVAEVMRRAPQPMQAVDRRPKNRGTTTREVSFLVGDDAAHPTAAKQVENARSAREEGRTVAEKRLGVRLVFAEELRGSEGNIAKRARRSEALGHRDGVGSMVALLERLGYSVYPGDVGVEGVYAMADLLAWRDDDILFVECLSQAAIKQGSHERKLALARVVPFCFVGKLPAKFLERLPAGAFAISQPHTARMSTGAVVPFFWRTEARRDRLRGTKALKVRLDVRLQMGRNLTHVSFSMPALRLSEDVAGFIWAAICDPWLRPPTGWTLRRPRAPIGHVPFPRVGLPNSSLTLGSTRSTLVVKMGRLPLTGELRGTTAALDALLDAIRAAGLSVRVQRAKNARPSR